MDVCIMAISMVFVDMFIHDVCLYNTCIHVCMRML